MASPWAKRRAGRLSGSLTPQSTAIDFVDHLRTGFSARYGAADEIDDVLCRGARREDLRHAELLELGDVVGRDRSSDGDDDVVDALLAQELDDAGHQRHVRP